MRNKATMSSRQGFNGHNQVPLSYRLEIENESHQSTAGEREKPCPLSYREAPGDRFEGYRLTPPNHKISPQFVVSRRAELDLQKLLYASLTPGIGPERQVAM
jgi:hypothetical protein